MRFGFAKKGLFCLNAPGQIDSGYHGPVKVIVANFSHAIIEIKDGDRFAQMWLEPVFKADWQLVEVLPDSE